LEGAETEEREVERARATGNEREPEIVFSFEHDQAALRRSAKGARLL
jgi:hypothetical protein